MDNLNQTIKNIFDNNIVKSIIIIIVSYFIYKLVQLIIKKATGNDKVKNISKKGKTYVRLTTNILRYIFIIITILILLQTNGIDVSSLLAGLGIASVIIGLAIQDALKDIIRGFSILSDNYFSVGDIVKYKEIEGKVLVIGLKSTKIQDISSSNVITIANRNIEQVEIVSDKIYINIPMPYEVPLDKAEKTVSDIVEEIKKNDKVTSCRYLSVNKLDDSAILYLIEVSGDPEYKLQRKRDALRVILDKLSKNNIDVPYQQIDIHNK